MPSKYRTFLSFLKTSELLEEVSKFMENLKSHPPSNILFHKGEMLMAELLRRLSHDSPHLKRNMEKIYQNLRSQLPLD